MADTYKIKNITVRQKIATGDDTYIVCGNSDYTVHWDLDDEWAEYNEKTMLVRVDNSPNPYTVQFTGTDAELPALYNTRRCVIGLMAGDVRTTTGAMFVCLPSARDASGAPVEPPADVYAQLVSQLAGKISEPSQDGSAGQALLTDGKGGRSWGDVASTPDWDQNDPAAKDYVKNRTHWVEPNGAKTEVFPEQSFSATIGTGYQIALEESQIPAVGSNWTAVFDGKTYTGETQAEDSGFPAIGNLSILDLGEDSGEPYLVVIVNQSGVRALIFVEESGNHTMSLSTTPVIVHTIDPKYMPSDATILKVWQFDENLGKVQVVRKIEIPTVQSGGSYWGREVRYDTEANALVLSADPIASAGYLHYLKEDLSMPTVGNEISFTDSDEDNLKIISRIGMSAAVGQIQIDYSGGYLYGNLTAGCCACIYDKNGALYGVRIIYNKRVDKTATIKIKRLI